MGDYTARKWRPVERAKDFVEMGNDERRQVIVKPSLKFDQNGMLVK